MLLCNHLQIIPEDAAIIKEALNQETWTDLEDGLQMQCAKERNLDYIVTRNIKDFSDSPIQPLSPEDFIEIVRKED